MTSTTNTPLMNMALPIPSVEVGPDWASQLNAAFNLVDSHDHTTGKGSKIPTSALNVNALLDMGGFDVIGLRSTRFKNQTIAFSAVADKSCLYVLNGELYFRDEVGNNVKMTNSGAVDVSGSGNITGMGSTTASVVYVDLLKTFTFYQNTGIAAKVSVGPLKIYEAVSSGKYVQIKTTTGLASSYDLTLPAALPAAEYPVFVDASGNMSMRQIVAGDIGFAIGTSQLSDLAVTEIKLAALSVSAAKIQSNAVTTAKIANGSITPEKLSTPSYTIGSYDPVNHSRIGSDTEQTFNLSGPVAWYNYKARPALVKLFGNFILNQDLNAPQSANMTIRGYGRTGAGAYTKYLEATVGGYIGANNGKIYIPLDSLSFIYPPNATDDFSDFYFTYQLNTNNTTVTGTGLGITAAGL